MLSTEDSKWTRKTEGYQGEIIDPASHAQVQGIMRGGVFETYLSLKVMQ